MELNLRFIRYSKVVSMIYFLPVSGKESGETPGGATFKSEKLLYPI